VAVPPDEYFPPGRHICDKYDILLILEEMMTGSGRSGKRFGQHHWGMRPEIMAFAGGITSGYRPLLLCLRF
jgi:adenosylmethionine-8-amino-7-oxononanoate aminotransferase